VVRVVHVIPFAGRGCRAPLETRAEAELVVEEAVFTLRMAGVGASGRTRSALGRPLCQAVVDEALRWHAHVIVVGTTKPSRWRSLVGPGTAERIRRASPLPVVTAEQPPPSGTGRPSADLSPNAGP